MGMPVVSLSRYEDLSSIYESQNPPATSHLPSSYTEGQIEGYKQQQKVYTKLLREKNVQWNEMILGVPGGFV
jgi:hypothetical protein